MFTLGYNTNGLAHHRLTDAFDLLAELGYGAVALTPDVGHLDPLRATPQEVAAIRERAESLGLGLVIETGARFVLDPTRKHFPTLLEDSPADRLRRLDFLRRCVDLAADLGAPLASIWSGATPDGQVASDAQADGGRHWDRLCEGLVPLLEHARGAGVQVGFEPEPGMFVERPTEYTTLLEHLGAAGEDLWLTLDVGHLVVTGDLPVDAVIRENATRIRNVHLDDCPAGIHRHGLFGTGDLDLQAALRGLKEAGYDGVASVELSRDSHRGAEVAKQALGQLRAAMS